MSMPTASSQSIFGQNVWKVLYLVVFVFVSHRQNSVNGRDRGFHAFTVIGWPHHTIPYWNLFFPEVFVWKKNFCSQLPQVGHSRTCFGSFGRNVESFEPMSNKPSSKGLEALKLVCLWTECPLRRIVIVCIRLFDLNWRPFSRNSKFLQVWRQKTVQLAVNSS